MAGDRDTERSLRRLNAAEKRQEKGSKIMVLSTGVELEALVVPPMLLTDIAGEAMRERPRPPVTYVEAVDRDEENPDDPVFKEALSNWQAGVLIDLNNAYILVGTRLVSKPDGLPGWDDADWLDEMKLLGRRVGSRRQRYLAWIKYVAAPTGEDITLIVREVGRLSGVSERDVQESIDGFQREGARDAGDGAGAQARGERGDHVLDPAP
jgi:hypothetical protein